ncbi:hypothetical protein F5X68DRAFT_189672 [Plectosphaerella plurivora]|uniref:Transcription factor RfeG n=1 Tax=Plectosphaerella plurivora TaxID=936078 RepID=A0A9P8VEP3_9PEZI|nr:hypothetical protein F5X68DRAFT_189672 [Plectosphaerella plurivora]
MASRRPQGNPPPSGAGGGAGRSNEYFVPRDGIDREVITADICRYLGNDALVRPGHYENPQTGQVSQGYYITAYRNLTTAMIDDLKADSARWEAERRQQAARNAPAGTSRPSGGVKGQPSRRSNSPVLGYRDSATHNARQHFGPSDSGPAGYSDRDPYDNASSRYPGSLAPGYSGNSAGGGFQQAPPQGQYAAGSSYYPPQAQGGAPSFAQPDPRDPRYAAAYGGNMDPPYAATAANLQARYNDYAAGGPAQPSRGSIPSSMPASQASTYISAGPSQTTGYAPAPAGGYYGQSPSNPAYGGPPPPVQSQDPLYGRGAYSSSKDTSKRASSDYVASPAGASQGFNSGQGQQYAAPPNQRSSVPSPSAQMTGGAPPPRPRERESDRHHGDRHRNQPRR